MIHVESWDGGEFVPRLIQLGVYDVGTKYDHFGNRRSSCKITVYWADPGHLLGNPHYLGKHYHPVV